MQRPKSQRLKIKIKNSQRKIHINKKEIAFLAKQLFFIKGKVTVELSILFAGKNRIRALNKKFRKIDKPTDVLAFNMQEGKTTNLHPEVLGDVVICPEVAQQAAKLYKTSAKQELDLYLIHGILHLLGYEHSTYQARVEMEKEQTRIFKRIIRK